MKTERLQTEIEKTKTKIGELKAKLSELERLKTEQENTEIIELVRALDATPKEITVMLRAMRESQRQQAMASLAPQIEDDASVLADIEDAENEDEE
jgi:flagellar basal body P-ring protein FlgI